MSPVRARSLAPNFPPSRAMMPRRGAARQRGDAPIVKTFLPWLPPNAASAIPDAPARHRGADRPDVPLGAQQRRFEPARVFSPRISRRRSLLRAQRLCPDPCLCAGLSGRHILALRRRVPVGSRRADLPGSFLRDGPPRRMRRRTGLVGARRARQFPADPGALAGPLDQSALMVAQRRMVRLSPLPSHGWLALALQRPDRGRHLFCAAARVGHRYHRQLRRPPRDRRRLGRARALPEFALGVITYRAFSDPHAARIWRSDVAFLAVAGALALAFEFMPNDGIIVALLPLLLLAAVRNTGLAARALNAAPLRWMGDISYSVYLGQAFAFSAVLTLATTPLGPALGLDGLRAIAVVFALAIGALIYRCVEVPCRALLRRAPDQLRRLAARA